VLDLMPRESFLLRTDPKVLAALRRWAEDELRSTNGQLDFILRKALKQAGRFPPAGADAESEGSDSRTDSDS
jgi:hypothetical protein